MLADHVLRSPRLAGRRTLVVQHAHGRAIVDERFEQDRPCVPHDRVAVLEQDRELLEVRVARLLHVDSGAVDGGSEALAPLAVSRMRPEEELWAAGGDCSHQATSRSTKRCSYGVFVGVLPMTSTSGSGRVEAVGAQERFVGRAGTPRVEDVRLRPAGHDDALRADSVVALQVLPHDLVLDDVTVAEGAR